MGWEQAPGLPARTRGRAGRRGAIVDALDAIPDGSRVHIESSCGFPIALADALAAGRDRWTSIEVVSGTQHLSHPLFETPTEPFRYSLLQASAPLSAAVSAGDATVVPASYAQFPAMCAPGSPLAPDIALIQVSEPDADGMVSLGTTGGDQVEIVRTTPMVIAEINPRMPYTFGASQLHLDEIDLLVEVEHELPEVQSGEFGAVEEAIAGHAAEQIPDGATVQFGIGKIPDAIVSQLRGHTDLGVHSGMIGDACMRLVDAGVLTGARKSIDAGTIIAGVVIGTRTCFDWIDRNPDIVIVPATYSHGAPVLARVERLAAINSVVEVALDGSMNAEQIGDRVISGPGGQPDYALAAHLSPGGVGITAMTSTAARGTQSRIVPRLDPAVPVTTPRYLADRVITEHGVAHLKGVDVRERAERLRAIAHPDFRHGLTLPGPG